MKTEESTYNILSSASSSKEGTKEIIPNID